MTEADWLSCTDPQQMLNSLQWASAVSDRKARLLAIAVCRRVGHLLVHAESRACVEAAERYADGLADAAEVAAAGETAETLLGDAWHGPFARWHEAAAATAAEWACWVDEPGEPPEMAAAAGHACERAASALADANVYVGSPYVAFAEGPDTQEQAYQAALVRDIFGPLPFRRVAFAPAWRTPAAVALSRSMYEGQRFENLPLLGDALEEAGCADPDVLNHCRRSGVHVKGCWVLDLVLDPGELPPGPDPLKETTS